MLNRRFLILAILTCCILYMNAYMCYKPDINIIQTRLSNIDFDILSEKYPIVIYDRILKPQDLVETLFKYSYIQQKNKIITFNDNAILNLSKYLILFNPILDVDLNIIHPKYKIKFSKGLYSRDKFNDFGKEIVYFTIKLKKDQVCILPAFWIYFCNFPLQSISLYDTLHLGYEYIHCHLF